MKFAKIFTEKMQNRQKTAVSVIQPCPPRFINISGYTEYKCLNGLIDISVPIEIEGRHIANLFTGQFLYETPDEEFFSKQAERYGFNKKQYFKALKKVPVFSWEEIEAKLAFLVENDKTYL